MGKAAKEGVVQALKVLKGEQSPVSAAERVIKGVEQEERAKKRITPKRRRKLKESEG